MVTFPRSYHIWMGNRCDDVDLLIPLLYVVIREYKYSKVLGNEGLEFIIRTGL